MPPLSGRHCVLWVKPFDQVERNRTEAGAVFFDLVEEYRLGGTDRGGVAAGGAVGLMMASGGGGVSRLLSCRGWLAMPSPCL